MDTSEVIREVAEHIQKNTTVEAIFGKPVERGHVTIIPVSQIKISGGGGGGSTDEKKNQSPKGSGMGLGVSIKAIPLGYIEIKEDSARFVEISRRSRIKVMVMALGALTVFSLTRMVTNVLGKKCY
ncbi:MAG: GerW family sporulation protein [Candidatus Omnitrophota bacterium]